MLLKEYQVILFMMTLSTIIIIFASFFAVGSMQQAFADQNITSTITKAEGTNTTNATTAGGITSGGSAGEDESAGEDTTGD